jgi:acetyl-CoA carboxylase biotin carboxyl carrier protein
VTPQDSSSDVDLLIAEFEKSGLRELHVRCDRFELYLSKDAKAGGLDRVTVKLPEVAVGPAPASGDPAPVPAHSIPAPAMPTEQNWPKDAVIVRAPYLGTFYRSPKPGMDPYVTKGQTVTTESDVCLVEVMKLFTAVRAGHAGKIHEILAADGSLVVADQPLFVIVPA